MRDRLRLRERRKLSWAGICAVSLVFEKSSVLADSPIVSVFGAPAEIDGDDVVDEIQMEIVDGIRDMAARSRLDDDAVTVVVKRAVRDVMTDLWGKRPVISVLIHRISR